MNMVPTPDSEVLKVGTGALGSAAAVGSGAADWAIGGIAHGLGVAQEKAGDVLRSVLPESVIDRIPFLVVDGVDAATDAVDLVVDVATSIA